MDNSKQVTEAYTFFMIPFSFETDQWKTYLESKLDRWEPNKEELYKGDVLFPYVMDLFRQHEVTKKSHLDIYRFVPSSFNPKDPKTLFMERVLGKTSVAVLKKSQPEMSKIPFVLCNKGNFAPLLFIAPTAKIGVLSFCIKVKDITIGELKALNCSLCKQRDLNEYQCVCFWPENQDKTDKDELQSLIESDGFWKSDRRKTWQLENYVLWSLKGFADGVLATFGKKENERVIKYFNNDRMHFFTYCFMEESACETKREDVVPELLCLSRGVDGEQKLPIEQLERQGGVIQVYENVCFSVSMEGTAAMAWGNNAFVKEFQSSFGRTYFVIYMLALLQRYTLFNMENQLNRLEYSGKRDDEELWELIELICRLKVNCYYTDVSFYSHYSQFYQHCCKHLNVIEAFKEIDGKVGMLKLTTERNMNKFMKESEAQQAQFKEATEKSLNLTNYVISFLTVLTTIPVVHDIIETRVSHPMQWSIGAGAVVAAILFIVMIYPRISNKSKKTKNDEK